MRLPEIPSFEVRLPQAVSRMMLEMFFAETYGADLHDSIYAKPVGPPRIGLRLRCASPIAHHGPDHWVSKDQRCRNDRAFVNVNCKCRFSFKVHRSLSRCEIAPADIVRINRYGEGYQAYIRQRIDDAASISQIAKELGIGKGVVIQLSRRKPLPVTQRYATGAILPTASTSRKSSDSVSKSDAIFTIVMPGARAESP